MAEKGPPVGVLTGFKHALYKKMSEAKLWFHSRQPTLGRCSVLLPERFGLRLAPSALKNEILQSSLA